MKKGTFNKIIRFGNLILKLSTNHTSVAKEMLKLDTKDVKKYENDISKVGIKTSKVYLSLYFNEKNIIIQEFINGKTIQEYLDSNEFSIASKLKLFKNVIELYKLSLRNENLCLDWNLNNFIIENNEIYYIDYVPALYKDKIHNTNSERLEEYKLSLIDKKIQLAGIISYAIIPFFDNSKEELTNVYKIMKGCIEEILNIKIDFINNTEHVYLKKLAIIESYLNSNKSKQEFLKEYSSISMIKTANIRRRTNE